MRIRTYHSELQILMPHRDKYLLIETSYNRNSHAKPTRRLISQLNQESRKRDIHGIFLVTDLRWVGSVEERAA